MNPLRCPHCGEGVRVRHHIGGGGRMDCFACKRVWITYPVSGGFAIQKFRYVNNPHSGTQLEVHPAGKGKHPVKITDPVRQLPNAGVDAW